MTSLAVGRDGAVLVDRPRDEIALVTLNRPTKLNALTVPMLEELFFALDTLTEDESCRVVVLTGAGRGFCSGIDRDEAVRLMSAGGAGGDAFAEVAPRVRAIPQPVVAAVNGPAIGGGFVIALAADVRVVAASASFADGFVRVGLSACEMGISWLLSRHVGASHASEILLTGRTIDAPEAARIGLASRVVPDGTALDSALALAGEMLTASAPGLIATKRAMWATRETATLADAIELETRAQAETLAAVAKKQEVGEGR